MQRSALLRRLSLGLLGLIVLLSPTESFGLEAACRVVTQWNAGCAGGARSWWDNMVLEWYDAITDGRIIWGHGAQAYTAEGSQVNGNIVDSDFTDATYCGFGNDNAPGRPDDVDAFMLGMHGIDYAVDHRWLARVRVNEPGAGNCNAYQWHMRFGNGDLEFLHLSSCYSMDREDWWPEWSRSFDGLHQIDAFHGIMWIGAGLVNDYEDFADDSFWTNIANAWIDNMYHRNISDGVDQCPVARNVGSNRADSSNRMNNERYNAVFFDPPGTGVARNHRARYVRGCDPQGKGAL